MADASSPIRGITTLRWIMGSAATVGFVYACARVPGVVAWALAGLVVAHLAMASIAGEWYPGQKLSRRWKADG